MAVVSAARAHHLRQPVLLLALGLGSGLARRGPGTAGTAVGVALFLLLAFVSPPAVAIGAVLATAVGVPLCGVAARRLGVHDDPAIVWDEIAGYLVAMIAVPAQPVWILVGFGVFRAFDIAKPGPIRWADRRLHGGLGIMADDVLAGAATCAVLHALLWLSA